MHLHTNKTNKPAGLSQTGIGLIRTVIVLPGGILILLPKLHLCSRFESHRLFTQNSHDLYGRQIIAFTGFMFVYFKVTKPTKVTDSP